MIKRAILCCTLILLGIFFLFPPGSEAQGMRGGMMGGGFGMMGPAWGRGAWMGPGYWGGYGNQGYGYPGYGYNPGYGQAAPPSGTPLLSEETKELREKIEKKLREVESLIGKDKPDKEKILAAHRELLDLQSQLEQKALQFRLENPQPAGPMPSGGGNPAWGGSYGGNPAWGGNYGGNPAWGAAPGWAPWGFGAGCPYGSMGYYNPASWGASPYSPYGGGHDMHMQHQQHPAAPGGESTK